MNEGWLPPSGGGALAALCFAVVCVALAASIRWIRRAPPVPDERPLFQPLSTGVAIGLAATLAVAIAARAFGLDSGLWYDEVLTLVRFARLSTIDLLTHFTSPNNHILYSLLAHGSISAFGESAAALRLPAAAFGVASVGALWLLGQEVTSRREALLASLLLAVSYHHVWFSQNARGYTGLLLFSLLGTWIFVAGMRRRLRGLWLAYAVVFALAMFTHLSAVLLFAAHGIVWVAMFAVARLRPSTAATGGLLASTPGAPEWWPLLGFALGGLLTLQLYTGVLPDVVATFAEKVAQTPAPAAAAAPAAADAATSWQSPLWTALEILRGLRIGLKSALGLAVAGVLAAAGFLSYARRDALVACVFTLPFAVTVITLLAISFRIWPRYFFVLIGFAALVLVRGAFAIAAVVVEAAATRWPDLARRPTAAVRLGIALALVPVAASAVSLAPNYQLPKQDYAGARDYVEAARRDEEPVVTIGLVSYPFEAYYAPAWHAAENVDELEAIRRHGSRSWLVYSFPGFLNERYPGIQELVEADFEPMREFPGTLGDGTIYVFRSRDPGAAGSL